MLAVLVLLSVLGAALPLLPPPASQALLKKYAFIKIMSSCLGEESVEQWMEQFRSACQRCYASPTADISPDFQDILDELRLQSYRRPVYVPIPVYQPLQQPQQGAPQSGQLPQQGQSAQYNPFQSSGASRSRREAGLSPEHLKNLKTLIIAKISNITCVLRELKLLASNNLPNYSYIGKELLSLPVEDGLKADLGEALQECRDLSLCLPVHKDKHPINKELGTVSLLPQVYGREEASSFRLVFYLGQGTLSSSLVAVCMKADPQKHAEKTGWAVRTALPLPGLLWPHQWPRTRPTLSHGGHR
nr:uncharacterized protein LOC128684049 [Cherax quadricarinatus]